MKDYTQLLQKQREFFDTNATKSVAFRVDALKKIYEWTKTNQDKISLALKQDLNKSGFEAYAT